MSIHCFYHSADLDGHCSGAIVKYRFPEAIMHPINYGDEFPWGEIQNGDQIYMVDFGLQPFDPHMIYLANHGEDTVLIWIDHHKSAIDEYNKWYHKQGTDALDYMLFEGERDSSRAACELTWEYLFPDKPVPLAVKLLSLYDSWTYEDHELEPMVLPFQMRMRMEDLDPKNWEGCREVWEFLFHEDYPDETVPGSWAASAIEARVDEGKLLLRYDEEQKRRYVKTYGFETSLRFGDEPARLGGKQPRYFSAIAVNLGHTNSKVFDSVWRKPCPHCVGMGGKEDCPQCNDTYWIEPYDLMITFVRRSGRKWNVSLYSTKSSIDCGAIAKSFGGGGHKGAAGFQCEDLPFQY